MINKSDNIKSLDLKNSGNNKEQGKVQGKDQVSDHVRKPVFNQLHQHLIEDDENLYKCYSKDSLSSLQQLAYSKSSPNNKKYISNDRSTYLSRGPAVQSFNSPFHTNTAFLKPKMKFSGFQISGYKKYQVTVTLQTTHFPISGAGSNSGTVVPHLTGFLTIKGLTNYLPEISTFFEGYAVTDNAFGFFSSTWNKLKDFTATDEIDLEHWLNFPSFKELFGEGKSNLHDGSYIEDYINKRFIFMRWKEKFLVPDAFVDLVEGASYDGFYYIVHDQLTGNVQGFYFHKDAERFQQLELLPYAEDTAHSSFEFA